VPIEKSDSDDLDFLLMSEAHPVRDFAFFREMGKSENFRDLRGASLVNLGSP